MTDKKASRVAILSDTHGFLDPRIAERVAECDYAVHAGDVGGADVLCALQPRQQVVAVRGNNDTSSRWTESETRFLENLPAEARLDLPGGTVVVVHGDDNRSISERHRHLRKRYPDARLIVYGHSHRLMMDTDEEPWVVNPGAAGRTRTYGGPSCLLLHCNDSHWELEALQLPARKYPNRDHQRRARQAG
ncbi:putative phosphoesterase [Natronocella acetinitrilica]|uniref:Phosphoesterase n=1 Tax=Natronocella acetinitrilica TaxID=414046 RepID=A0AAE3KCM2_9GAMM|nr:metallophosphoesterase family protein [Natronocella acetinitrilica]MCP1675921.1 putative phosphoesterase [Natronocella acetinitrilica]